MGCLSWRMTNKQKNNICLGIDRKKQRFLRMKQMRAVTVRRKRAVRKMMKLLALDIFNLSYRIPSSIKEQNRKHRLTLTSLVMLLRTYQASVGSRRCTTGQPQNLGLMQTFCKRQPSTKKGSQKRTTRRSFQSSYKTWHLLHPNQSAIRRCHLLSLPQRSSKPSSNSKGSRGLSSPRAQSRSMPNFGR